MMKWGKKAGDWGKGVEGEGTRQRKARGDEMGEEDVGGKDQK